MLLTSNFGLKKPEATDPVDVQDFNDNADIIDTELKKRPESDGSASDMTVEFEPATQLTELTSKDSLKGLFGKLALAVKTVMNLVENAITNAKIANNDSTTAAGYVADARIVKKHGDEIDALNDGLANSINTRLSKEIVVSGLTTSVDTLTMCEFDISKYAGQMILSMFLITSDSRIRAQITHSNVSGNTLKVNIRSYTTTSATTNGTIEVFVVYTKNIKADNQ